MAKRKWMLFLLFFMSFAVCGYLREFFFVHMNNIMFMKYYHSESPLAVPPVMKGFQVYSYDTLYYLKYLFTVIWTILFFLLNYYALRTLTVNPLFIRLLLISYAGMLTLSALSMLYGYFVNHQWDRDEYTLSRWLMGIAQSPLICLILLAASKLSFQGPNTKGTEDHQEQ